MNIRPTDLAPRASGMRLALRLLVCALGLWLVGCATGPGANPRDPIEPLNRGVFEFNEAVDKAFLEPVAEAYTAVTPRLVRTGVSNFFNNLGEFWSVANNLLQAKPRQAVETWFRILVNTLIGMGGVFDVATEMGIETHREDFGQTLGRWGVPPGPYVVVPLFGPSTVRDLAATVADTFGYPVGQITPVRVRNVLIGLDAIDNRAGFLQAGKLLDASALDKYVFSRDVYLQKRRNDVYDGSPPEEEDVQEPDAPEARP